MAWNFNNRKIRFLNIEFPQIELFLLFGFILFHIVDINSLRFLYNDMEVLLNLYRFENISHGEIPFITHTDSYGPLISYFHAIFYKMMPPGIFSTNIILLIISPIISLFIGYACARLIFKDSFYRICFLVLTMLLVTYTESWYYSCRVWAGLLTLALFSSGLQRAKKYYLFLSGILLTVAFFLSHEIAIYASASIFLAVCIILLLEKRKFSSLCYVIYGLLIGMAFFSVIFHKFIKEYLSSIVIQSQHYNWAMGWSFPGVFDGRNKILFGFFRPFVIYLLGLINIIFISLVLKRDCKIYIAKLLPFVLFGFFCYRTLMSRSDDGHLHFILAPAIIVLILLIEIYLMKQPTALDFMGNRYFLGIFIVIILGLFFFRNILLDQFLIYKNRCRLLPKSNESFYSPFGIFLENDMIQEFEEVSNYIKENTSVNDFIYVFPRGPYYYLTDRRNPTPYYYLHLLYTRKMRQELIEEIERKRTKYIINPIVWFPDMNNLLFAQEMQDYVQSHFFFEKKIYNTLIFKRRPYPVKKIEPLLTKEWAPNDVSEIRLDGLSGQFGKGRLKVVKNKPILELTCSPSFADMVEIKISLLHYSPFMRSLAKPSLELISYDNNGMLSYDKLSIPTDGEQYAIRYSLGKTREIIKLVFVLNAPGLFNPQPLYISIDSVSLLQR